MLHRNHDEQEIEDGTQRKDEEASAVLGGDDYTVWAGGKRDEKSAGQHHVSADHPNEMEDVISSEECEEGDYIPDDLEWKTEESSDYSSVEEGSEGDGEEVMGRESEDEEQLVWKKEKETGSAIIKSRKRLPKHLDDGDVSLYQARIR